MMQESFFPFFDRLPPEILREIFLFLGAKSLTTAAQVCKTWKKTSEDLFVKNNIISKYQHLVPMNTRWSVLQEPSTVAGLCMKILAFCSEFRTNNSKEIFERFSPEQLDFIVKGNEDTLSTNATYVLWKQRHDPERFVGFTYRGFPTVLTE
jgi:hypothetical protein